ncbi:MAG: ammonia-forming cytochrome c nitrite reductase subunit c552 [Proteobacteria bacterium]|jgi:nitrite reductase (cytochrome c-552)|nr:ammonia-forming cytochrome c nitrite reductase subunit c552 [Pseudomonadota bacterium]
MSNPGETKRSPFVGWLIFLVALVVVFVLGLLAAGITEKRAEVASVFNNKRVEIASVKPTFVPSKEPSKDHDKMKVEIAKTTPGIDAHNDVWGVNYPREYSTWQKTRETDYKSKYLGNAPEDVLESRPNMVVLWAGYAFSRDYSAPRGHWYTLYDMRKSLRTGAPGVGDNKDLQPGTCWTCKSPDVPRVMQEIGLGKYYSSKWSELGPEIVNPLGCADCHDPKTMALNISRPALVEAFKRGGRDITKATPNEMRSLVCAQCHVEYYFGEGDGKYLTFPWDLGNWKKEGDPFISVEQMEKYYDQPIFGENAQPYKDWVHALSKAPMLKAQHPDYELWAMGTHGKRGVSCADCHLPYVSEGGVKYTDHQIMSPLKNVARVCQNCHRDSEEKLKGYVYDNQDKILEIRDRVETELTKAHILTKVLLDSGKVTADSAEIKPVHQLLREAGWRWDMGVASHGASFHAPVETARILSHALDKSLLAQIEVQKLLTKYEVPVPPMPDLAHWKKADAQAFIGLNMDKLKADKIEFMKTVVPGWIEQAKAKGKLSDPDLLNQYKNVTDANALQN